MEEAPGPLPKPIAPIGRAIFIALGLSMVQVGLLYVLTAADLFERMASVYNLYSYPFNVLGTITVTLSSIALSDNGATQLLHMERVYLRIFTVVFTVYIIYFPLSRHLGFRREGHFRLYLKDPGLKEDWKWAEAIMEDLGMVVALTFVQISVIYLLHTMGLFGVFQSAYNTLFFPFNYLFVVMKSLSIAIYGQNDYIAYLNTDILKRVYFLILAVNIVYFTIAGLLGARNETHG